MLQKTILKILENKLGCSQVKELSMTLSQCFRYETDKGEFFVKVLPTDDIEAAAAEAAALAEIDETETLVVPRPFYYGYLEEHCFIILEYLELKEHNSRSMAKFGEELAKMHLAGGPEKFGFEMDNLLGMTWQVNDFCSSWVDFYRENRLMYQLKLAEEKYDDAPLREAGERLLEKLPQLFEGMEIRPSLLHGDLWAGNCAVDKEDRPVVFDPASYYGHHEAELSIAGMFGGFTKEFYDAYYALIPKAEGHEEREMVYRLYHYLNHYNIFGESYRSACMAILRHFD